MMDEQNIRRQQIRKLASALHLVAKAAVDVKSLFTALIWLIVTFHLFH